jgi:hypothetical protein
MLFSFNYIWKSILILAGSWAIYGLCGFEFTIVTLMAVLLALKFKTSTHIF